MVKQICFWSSWCCCCCNVLVLHIFNPILCVDAAVASWKLFLLFIICFSVFCPPSYFTIGLPPLHLRPAFDETRFLLAWKQPGMVYRHISIHLRRSTEQILWIKTFLNYWWGFFCIVNFVYNYVPKIMLQLSIWIFASIAIDMLLIYNTIQTIVNFKIFGKIWTMEVHCAQIAYFVVDFLGNRLAPPWNFSGRKCLGW